MTKLGDFQEEAYALLRIISGLLFFAHGLQKFTNFPIAFPYPLDPLLTAAGVIEIIGGALVAIGLFTRPVAILCSGMSAMGYWMFHGMQSFFPIANGGETIILYCFLFLLIATKGVGKWGLDAVK